MEFYNFMVKVVVSRLKNGVVGFLWECRTRCL